MAEVLAGQHCSVKICKQLDFLPFTCDGCGQIFCLDHRSKDAHSCSMVLVDKTLPDYEGPKSYPCSMPDCKGRELMEVICPHCQLNFCLSHRHQVEHDCEKLNRGPPPVSKTAEHVKQILEAKQNQPPKARKGRGPKSSKTAAKVALMKLKMKACGDKGLPETEKVYFNVALPLDGPVRHKAMFFSKTWSIGRIIDNIATLCDLRNDNNTAALKKLRLFDGDSGRLLLTSECVDSFLNKEELFSGSTVILEYVNEGIDVIDNTDVYR
ncbi:LOW QUALITY PROTEIN: AN1-type zinc finger protein 1-like [Liolophura sinensis]|uniref:LOW QUALITY PROTEIN: AN1-type zinc finger protein 1-like n=1 Tax=Liolophura sinensis TaxID=3198878 RepID=UPI00315917F9